MGDFISKIVKIWEISLKISLQIDPKDSESLMRYQISNFYHLVRNLPPVADQCQAKSEGTGDIRNSRSCKNTVFLKMLEKGPKMTPEPYIFGFSMIFYVKKKKNSSRTYLTAEIGSRGIRALVNLETQKLVNIVYSKN